MVFLSSKSLLVMHPSSSTDPAPRASFLLHVYFLATRAHIISVGLCLSCTPFRLCTSDRVEAVVFTVSSTDATATHARARTRAPVRLSVHDLAPIRAKNSPPSCADGGGGRRDPGSRRRRRRRRRGRGRCLLLRRRDVQGQQEQHLLLPHQRGRRGRRVGPRARRALPRPRPRPPPVAPPHRRRGEDVRVPLGRRRPHVLRRGRPEPWRRRGGPVPGARPRRVRRRAQEAPARRGGGPRRSPVREDAAGGGGGPELWRGAIGSLAAGEGAVHAAGAGLRERRGAPEGRRATSRLAAGGKRASGVAPVVAPRVGRDRRGCGAVPGAVRRVDGGLQRLRVSDAMNRPRACNCNRIHAVHGLRSLCLLVRYHIYNL